LLMHYCSIRDKFSRKDISNIIDAIKIDNQIIYILDKIHSESKFDKLIKAITLSNQAELYDLYGFTTESEKKFIDSITIFKNRIRLTLTEKRDYLETSIKYCLLLIKLGQFSKVVEILSNIIDDMEKDKTQYLDIRSTAYCNRSIAYQHIGNLEKALVDLDKAIYLLENPKVDEIIDRCKSSMCYLNRSIVHLLNNNLPNALNDIQKSLELSDEVNEESRLNKAKALMNYANIKIKLGDDSNLFSILDEAIEILEKLKSDNLLLDEDVLIKTYNNKGLILSKDGKHIEAISWHTKAANLSENLKKQGRYYFEDELCRSYFLIATLYELDKKADDEKESYRKILSSFDFINYNSLKF
ncbi:MAG: tetratricopeptide repeat protein, partial [Clostridium butyricum]|nr:tetratricopeptide repeat protein [Clostridium butyricum]